MNLKEQFTNDTLEEELRVLVCEQKKEINYLKQNILHLKRMVAEESKAKYRAYTQFANLQEKTYSDKTDIQSNDNV